MILKNTANFVARRPVLVRVWRATGVAGAPLTSYWTAAASCNIDTNETNTAEGGIRRWR